MIKEQKTYFAFARKRIASLSKRIVGKFAYRICSFITRQDKLLLYSASPNDSFGNIEALARWFEAHGVEYIKTSQAEMIQSPIRFFSQLAKARILIIDAGSPAARVKLTPRTILIHCWHAGGAYKKIGFDAKRKGFDERKEETRIKRIHRNIAYMVCTSRHTAEIYAKAFHLQKEQMLTFGLPCLDGCLKQESPPTPSPQTILYAPTYRTNARGQRNLPQVLNMPLLRARLAVTGENLRFAFRGHPTLSSSQIEGWEDWSAIPQDEALQKTTVLITDYSSVFFDFLPYRRPIVFYVPDMEDYQIHERELYFSPYDEFPDTTCGDMESLVRIIRTCKDESVDYSRFWNTYMDACDGSSTERLCSFVLEKLKGSMI